MNILDKILKEKEFEVENLKKSFPLEQLQEGIFEKKYDLRSLYDALNNNDTKIIAEIKKASPSKGIIQENFQPLKIALEYFNGGASAISILTDEKFFQGKIDYITAVRSIVNIPILRKDFIVDDYQIYQSKFYGADAILLIGKALTLKKLASLCEISQKLNLDVIYEVHDNEDFNKGIEVGVKIFGVNNRNLETFDVDNFNQVPGRPKADMVFEYKGRPNIFVSHKKGTKPAAFQQYGGFAVDLQVKDLQSARAYPEIEQFLKDINETMKAMGVKKDSAGRYDLNDLQRGSNMARLIHDEDVANTVKFGKDFKTCLLYTSPSPRDS
mgnify:CR=1 FL=1